MTFGDVVSTGRDELPLQLRAAADELGVDADVDLTVSDGPVSHGEAAGRRGRRARIEISRDAITAGWLVLRGTLAHELAHVRDPLERRDRVLRLAVVTALGAPALGALMIYPTLAPPGVSRSLVVAVWFAGWPLLLATLAGAACVSHRRELRADRTAAQLLGDTAPVLAMIDRVPPVMAAYSTVGRLHARLTHPDPARRRRALRSLTEPTI